MSQSTSSTKQEDGRGATSGSQRLGNYGLLPPRAILSGSPLDGEAIGGGGVPPDRELGVVHGLEILFTQLLVAVEGLEEVGPTRLEEAGVAGKLAGEGDEDVGLGDGAAIDGA